VTLIVCTLNESTSRNKRRLSNETMGGKTKKLKAKANNHDDEIIRLSQFTQCKDALNDTSEQNSDDIGELKSLVIGLTGTMNSFCNVITQRMDDFEKNIPSMIASMIDRKISTEMQKVKQQVRNELKTVADKVENLEKSYESIKENRNQNTPEEIRVIVRNLPESDRENTLNKVKIKR